MAQDTGSISPLLIRALFGRILTNLRQSIRRAASLCLFCTILCPFTSHPDGNTVRYYLLRPAENAVPPAIEHIGTHTAVDGTDFSWTTMYRKHTQ